MVSLWVSGLRFCEDLWHAWIYYNWRRSKLCDFDLTWQCIESTSKFHEYCDKPLQNFIKKLATRIDRLM